jgi:signal transduction histidine kinase
MDTSTSQNSVSDQDHGPEQGPRRVGVRLDTHFAAPERDEGAVLKRAVSIARANPVTDVLLRTYGSILAILNRHRQIVVVNHVLLESLGVEDPDKLLGLRPGEALGCVHAWDNEAGCGTGPVCSTCGAALAILSSQTDQKTAQRECYITTRRNRRQVNLEFLARAVPVQWDAEPFTLLMLQDISDRKRKEALERSFFHDALNTATALKGMAELQYRPGSLSQEMLRGASGLISQLVSEMEFHRDLGLMQRGEYYVTYHPVTAAEALSDVRKRFAGHRLLAQREMRIDPPVSSPPVRTSGVLLARVLDNMVLNALEATPPGGQIRLWSSARPGRIDLKVWNAQHIEPKVAGRIFECHYSTTGEHGRGFGTYSMKLLTETYLNGQVSFVTSPRRGTIFRLRLPL